MCEYSSGARYEGEWKGGKRHGEGTLVDEYGNTYRGGWENDCLLYTSDAADE